MNEKTKSKGQKMNDKSNLEPNSAHLSNSKAIFCANLAKNLKVFFALPKWLKIFLCVLSVVAVSGVIASFALISWAKDKAQYGEFVFSGVDKAVQARLDSGFAYDGRLYFERLDVLLRSKVIAYIDITEISWVSQIDKNAVSEIKSQNRHIKFISSQNLSEFNGQKLGVVEYKMDFSPLVKTIVKYFVWIVVVVVGACVFYNSFKIYPFQANLTPITRKDYAFLGFAFALCASICAFTFWLGFPGYHMYWPTFINHNLDKINWHPVIISYMLQFLYLIFGKHFYYTFFVNLIPFYLGIFFLIAGFYLRSKNPFVLFLIFPTLIGNIYFQNFHLLSNMNVAMLLFCIYSLLLFIVLVPLDSSKTQKIIAKILWILLFMLMFFAILWRHNAIFSVFPAFFVVIYIILQNRNLDSKTFIKNYIALTCLSAILCVFVAIFIPKILAKEESYELNHTSLHQIRVGKLPHSQLKNPSNHIFLHQIAGACVPANDETCFKKEWYLPNKTFENVKVTYIKYPLNADSMNFGGDYGDLFKGGNLKEIKQQWIKAIFKYPYNYTMHEIRFLKAMWFQQPSYIFDAVTIQQSKLDLEWQIMINNSFPKNEHSIIFTPLQEKIYTFLFNHKILLNHAWGVGVGFVILMLSSVILWRRRKVVFVDNLCQNNTLLIFAFSVSFASFWSAFFIAAFSPVPESRYMSPILPMAIVALLGFVAFALDYLAREKVKINKN